MIKKSISVAAAFAVCSLALNAGFFATPAVAPDAPNTVSAAPADQSRDALVAKGSDSPVIVLARNTADSIVVPRTAVSDSPFVESKLSETEFIVDGERYPLREYKPFITPNDPAATQWWTTATGLPLAWDYGSSANTTIAVIDSGFALDHQEFVGRWAERAGEKGTALLENPSDRNCTDQGLPISAICNNIDDDQDGITDNESWVTSEQNPSRLNCTDRGLPLDKFCNLIDDDGNGYPDDWRGWDFASGDAYVQAGEVYPDGDGASHGTSVVGAAAATGNNGVGIAGVNWSAKILPLQALGDDGSGNTLSVSRAIRYAADQGVDVINLSLGSNFEDSYLRQAVQYALSKGAVVVAASGNDGCDCLSYPANYPEVVAVGATRSDGSVAGFSSYGDNLDLVAPGSSMYLPAW